MQKDKIDMNCNNEKQFNEVVRMLKSTNFTKIADCYWSQIYESENLIYVINRDY